MSDPYAAAVDHGPWRFLHRLNPVATLLAPVPVMIYLLTTRDVATPLAFLLLALALLVVGAALRPATLAVLLLGLPVAVLVLSVTFGFWAEAARIDASGALVEVGPLGLSGNAWEVGLATALRLASLLALTSIGGLTSTGPEIVRAAVAQLRIPYRVGYSALAAFRFVPRFAVDLATIRSAHRVRGMAGGRGPVAGLRRNLGYAVPLLAGGIRHAERVAMAMESRGFGAHPTRTERHVVPWRVRDTVAVAVFWLGSAAIAAATARGYPPS